MAPSLWQPNLDPDEGPLVAVFKVKFYCVCSNAGKCSAAVEIMAREAEKFEGKDITTPLGKTPGRNPVNLVTSSKMVGGGSI